MGYYMELRDESFFLPANKKNDALAAIKELTYHPELMNGGSWSAGQRTDAWFSWTDTNKIRQTVTLEDCIREWGWKPETDEKTGDIVYLGYDSNKIGQEEQMFKAIAPYVEDGCYLEMQGEDGEVWRWHFLDNKLYVEEGIITWNERSLV